MNYCPNCECDLCVAQRQAAQFAEALERAKQPGARCWSCSCGWFECYSPPDIAEYGEPSECQRCYRENLVETSVP